MLQEEHYASLMPEAYRRWAELEAASKVKIYTKTGGLYWGPPVYHAGSRATCDRLGVDYEILTPEQVEERWPPLRATPGWEGLFEPNCGVLHANDAVKALQDQAEAHGASLHEGCTVKSIEGGEHDGEPVTVRTTDGRTFVAEKCVITAGAWAGKLLRDTAGLELALQPTQNTVAYWPVSQPDAFSIGKFPVLISKQFYSLPSWHPEELGCWKIDGS